MKMKSLRSILTELYYQADQLDVLDSKVESIYIGTGRNGYTVGVKTAPKNNSREQIECSYMTYED